MSAISFDGVKPAQIDSKVPSTHQSIAAQEKPIQALSALGALVQRAKNQANSTQQGRPSDQSQHDLTPLKVDSPIPISDRAAHMLKIPIHDQNKSSLNSSSRAT